MIFSNQASRPDGGVRRGDGRRAALVPALLEHLERAGRELRPARRGLRLRGDRGHARHDDARLAAARPRPRVPAVPRGKGIAQYTSDPVFQRLLDDAPPVPAGGRADADGRAVARAARPRLPGLVLTNLRSGTTARGGRGLPRRRTRARRSPGTTCAFLREHDRAADRAEGRPAPRRRAAGDRARHGRDRSSRTTAAGRSTARSARSTRCRRSPRRSTAASRCCSTAASAAAPTRSRRSRSARRRSRSAGRTSTGWRSPARTGVGEVIRNLVAEFDLTLGLAGCSSIRELTSERLTRPTRMGVPPVNNHSALTACRRQSLRGAPRSEEGR